MTLPPANLFLSHAGADTGAARALKKKILAAPIAKKAGLSVWFDKDDLEAGRDWQEQLEAAIAAASAFAVYIGEGDVSRWVTREVRLALSQAVDRPDFRFVPVFARDPSAADGLPTFARQYQGVIDPLGDPGAMQALLAAVTSQEPAKVQLVDEPFVGPEAMTEAQADLFFGRSNEISDLIGRCKRHEIVAVIADSGAGKSSLVQAGLIPEFYGGALEDRPTSGALRRQRVAIVMNPAGAPLERLKIGLTHAAERLGKQPDEIAALRKRLDLSDPSESAFALRCDLDPQTTDTLLVVDQFEELLTQTPSAQRQPFVDFLMALVDPHAQRRFRIVLTMRADYANLLKRFPALHEALCVSNGAPTLRLKGISDQGLEQVVKRPLAMGGVAPQTADTLFELVHKDKQDQPGDLALVQIALWAAWRRHKDDGNNLLQCYADINGVQGALAHEAGRVLEKLPQSDHSLLESILMRLIQLGDTGGAVRRLASMGEFDGRKTQLISDLADKKGGRLLVTGDDTVQISHEALIRQWDWLQDLADRNAGASRVLMRLIDRAKAWDAASSPALPSMERRERIRRLLRRIFGRTAGNPVADFPASRSDLEDFERLRNSHAGWLSANELEFVEAGVANRQAQVQEDEFLTTSLRTMWAYLSLATVVLTVVLMILVVYAVQLSRSQKQIEESSAKTLTAMAKVEFETGNHLTAVKAALAALQKASSLGQQPDPTLVLTLREAFLSAGTRLEGHKSLVHAGAFSPDSKQVVTVSGDKTAIVWDVPGGKMARVIRAPGESFERAVFAPDSTRIATADRDKVVWIWPAEANADPLKIDTGLTSMTKLEFSGDGARILVLSLQIKPKISLDVSAWDARTGTPVKPADADVKTMKTEWQAKTLKSDWLDKNLTPTIIQRPSDGSIRIWSFTDMLGSFPAMIQDTAPYVPWASPVLPMFNPFMSFGRSPTLSPDGRYCLAVQSGKTALLCDLRGLSADVVPAACDLLEKHKTMDVADLEKKFRLTGIEPICTPEQRKTELPVRIVPVTDKVQFN